MASKAKGPALDDATKQQINLFESIGLSKSKAAEAAKSPKPAAILQEIIEQHGLVAKGPLEEKQASAVVALAGQLAKSGSVGGTERTFIIDKILKGDLKSVDQATGMSSFQRRHC